MRCKAVKTDNIQEQKGKLYGGSSLPDCRAGHLCDLALKLSSKTEG